MLPRTPIQVPASFWSPSRTGASSRAPATPQTASGGGANDNATTTAPTSQSSYAEPRLNLSLTTPHQNVINLQTRNGAALFKAASGENLTEADRIECTLGNANSVVEYFIDIAGKFGFTLAIHGIPVQFGVRDVDGQPQVLATKVASILTSKNVAEADVLLNAALAFTQKTPELPPVPSALEDLKARALDSSQPKLIVPLDDADSAGQVNQYSTRMSLDMLGNHVLNKVDAGMAARLRLLKKQ